MTNTQYYIAVGIPFFTILLVWLGTSVSNKHSADAMRAAIEALGVSIRAEMKTGFDAVNRRLDRLETIVDRIDGEIRIDHERRIVKLEERLLTKAS